MCTACGIEPFAIADTGTLAFIATAVEQRLVSSLPMVHVAIAATRSIVPDMPAFLATGAADHLVQQLECAFGGARIAVQFDSQRLRYRFALRDHLGGGGLVLERAAELEERGELLVLLFDRGRPEVLLDAESRDQCARAALELYVRRIVREIGALTVLPEMFLSVTVCTKRWVAKL